MTNPDNIVRVRARNGGRASVYEANGWAQAYSMGLLEGNGVTQNTSADMNVLVGGSTTKPDVVIAENPAGYKIALDLVTQQAIAITAPASNSRISAIVAYTDDLSLQSTETDITGSPASCGLIVVNGTTAATPAIPDDSQIRSAITADGATGSQASYCIIATVEVAAGTTIITDSQITNRVAKLSSSNVDFRTLFTQKGQSNFVASAGTPSGTLHYKVSADGKVGLLWCSAASDGVTSGQKFTADTPLRPSTTTSINSAVIMQIGFNQNITANALTIDTNGKVSFGFNSAWGNSSHKAIINFALIMLD